MITVTTDFIARVLWGCSASDLTPEGSMIIGNRCIFPDASGATRVVDPYTGEIVRGWPVAHALSGHEVVRVVDHGNVITFEAAPHTLARTGSSVSGREGRKLRSAIECAK